MRKKITLLLSLVLIPLLLEAKSIELTPQQIKDWHIKMSTPKVINNLPLGNFMAEVITPPQYLYSIALPFEAQIKELKVAQYQKIKKGQLLATVTGHDWITIQQQFIQDSIELKHHKHVAERKNRLCQEEIIAKKECLASNAEYKADKIKFASAKALLRGYGATNKIINDLFRNLKISQTIPLQSSFSGTILKLNVRVGKSTQPSESLFIIQKEGALWLEADVLAKNAMELKDGDLVKINFAEEEFQSRVLLHAPTINIENQTQKVRFSLPNKRKFLTGLRDSAKIILPKKTLKVSKKSVISLEGKEVVFSQQNGGYTPIPVKIVGEERAFYFVRDNPSLHQPIVSSSVAILKSMMESEDE